MQVPQHELRHAEVAFNDDKTEVRVAGYRFKAEDKEPGECKGCAFIDGFGCSLWRKQLGSTLCQPKSRNDGRAVIWVKA